MVFYSWLSEICTFFQCLISAISYGNDIVFFLLVNSRVFGQALLGSFAATGYAPVYIISSFITLLALPICVFSLKKIMGFFQKRS